MSRPERLDPREADRAGSVVRAAAAEDVEAVGRIWQEGWADGHLGHVPEDLARARAAESYTERARDRLAHTWVAETDGRVAGFVVVVDDEVEQLYVGRGCRGTGVAAALLARAEDLIRAEGSGFAWLAVAEGNSRAQRFYARQGWTDDGAFGYRAETAHGEVVVPCRRYVRARGPQRGDQHDVHPDVADR